MTDFIPEEDSYEDVPEGRVKFVANRHAKATAPSGAVFSFTPGMTVGVTRSDAEALANQGLGAIEGA